MNYTIEQIKEGQEEVIVRYIDMTPEVDQIIGILRGDRKFVGTVEGNRVVIDRADILYIESVDSKTFAYTKQEVIRLEYTLTQLEQILTDINYFRCSKSMIINIDKVKLLRSLASNRIDATMENGEHVMISRTYASDFRKRLKGE